MMPLKILRIAIILTLLFSLFPMAVSADDDLSIEFIVKDGDNLYKICEKILENPEDWRWVAMVNRIRDPHRIFPGQKLIIPTRLLKGIPIDGLVTFIKGVVSIKLRSEATSTNIQYSIFNIHSCGTPWSFHPLAL